MKQIRRWHLFLSLFFAPMLLFYIGTGWYQTFTINRNKGPGEAHDLVSKLTSVHVDQLYPTKKAETYNPQAFKFLVVAMSISLIVTIGLGMYLAFTIGRPKWAVWLSLTLGVLLPILLLWLGQSG
jgi:hypothetical protein